MARFGINDYENYGGGSSNYFSLKDNGDTARIRFLYNSIEDVQGVAVHEVEVDGKKIEVECLRAYNEPVHKCPLCQADYRVLSKLYVPVYDIDNNESKIWTRGRTFFQKLSSLCSRYNPLVSTPFEVERVGKKGDTSTTYETYPMQSDNAIISDFPEVKAEGSCFQVKTAEEMMHYLETGSFGDVDVPQRAAQPQRASQPTQRLQREMPAAPVRRRPQYGSEDSF